MIRRETYWTTITDSEGVVEQELSFDAWGNRRDPNTWQNYSVAEPVEAPMFDRGYTGHEHMTAFGLINMNGRCYDPLTSHFLSVDAYVQDPTNAQAFNRYAYCAYNPLRYTDPTGWVYGSGSNNYVNPNMNSGVYSQYHSDDPNDVLWGRSAHPGTNSSSGYINGTAYTITKFTKGTQLPKIEFASEKEEEAYNEYRNKVFSHNTEEYKIIQAELLLLESAIEVFRIRMGENTTDEAGGGNFIYNLETNEFDVNLANYGDYNTMEKISHELKHAFQYMDGKLGFDLRRGRVNYIAYDFLDEEEAFKRQGLFGNTLKFEEIQTCYPELWIKGYFYKNQTIQNCAHDTPAHPFNLIKEANRMSYEHNKKPVYLYHGWEKDIH